MKHRPLILVSCLFSVFVFSASAGDWPMWRHDAQRTGVTPETLPKKLLPQWVCTYPRLERAWPDDDRLGFDVAYEPVVADGRLFFGSSAENALIALDADTGGELWRFHADGPIRFAPAASSGKVYFACDDGCLYCVGAESGDLAWRFQGAPSERRVLGNKRLISVWPARGAPVVANGTVYFGAGIWPFEGIFVYALDAATGKVKWANDKCDVPFMHQPHHSEAFAGVTPQGYLAVGGDKLLVPNGRAVAAAFDCGTGELEYFDLDRNSPFGGYRVAVLGDHFFNPSVMYEVKSGRNLGGMSSHVALAPGCIYVLERSRIRALDYSALEIEERKDRRDRMYWKWSMPTLWEFPETATEFIVADQRVYACKEGGVFALEIPKRGREPKVSWEHPVEGTPQTLLAADEKLFVVTEEGRIVCFGGKKGKSAPDQRGEKAAKTDEKSGAAEILAMAGVSEGYCLVAGAASGATVAGLAAGSSLDIVAIDSDAQRVESARDLLDNRPDIAGRATVLPGSIRSFPGPPYWASLVVCQETGEIDAGFVKAVFHPLRPYGGVACLPLTDKDHEKLAGAVSAAGLEGAQVDRSGNWTLLKRVGALPGSANWTHQYADAGNTGVSKDELVRAPLGLLWFGGSSNADILPRHGHGPSEQVVDGRLFIQGPDMLRALDIYTGRMLWQTSLPGVGAPFDNTSHQPGANALGSNYVSTPDAIYVAHGKECLLLNPSTGEKLAALTLPKRDGADEPPSWGYLGVFGNMLVAGSGPVVFEDEEPGNSWSAVSSKRLVAMNRQTGDVRWTREATASFRHNAVALGANKVFCLDRVTDALLERMQRRGLTVDDNGRLLALDIATGDEVWTVDENVFGTWLGYSAEHDILLQSGRRSRDMLSDEPNDRMIAYRGTDGSVLWDHEVEYNGPCLLHGDRIIAQEQSFSLLTGERILRRHPLTDAELPLTWTRNYGCNSAIACQNLVTFRSAAAGFFDLEREGGTGNLGGFKSGCTSNLIAAGGLLNAPDYTRTCTCSYQNQTSLALVHTPEVEMWTFNDIEAGEEPIRKLGINLGAPGDRRADNGTLWLDFPYVGGPSPDVAVEVAPEDTVWFRHHSSRMLGDGPRWIGASGGKHIDTVRVTLGKANREDRRYTVRLVFSEPDGLGPGERVFDVVLQGETVLEGFDVAREAGGPLRTVVKEFEDIAVGGLLALKLTPRSSETNRGAVLCGIEIVEM